MEITEDNECAICKDNMGTPSFSTEQTAEDEGVHRLSCHHAFHSSCLLSSFRINQTLACPLCRNTGGEARRTRTLQHGNVEITITENESVEEERSDFDDMMNSLRRLQKSPVRNARRKSKEALKVFNTLRDKLRHEKKRCVAHALFEFRKKFRREFRDSQKELCSRVKAVYQEEKKSFIEIHGEAAYQILDWRTLHDLFSTGVQYKDELSGRKNDPWNSSFWYA